MFQIIQLVKIPFGLIRNVKHRIRSKIVTFHKKKFAVMKYYCYCWSRILIAFDGWHWLRSKKKKHKLHQCGLFVFLSSPNDRHVQNLSSPKRYRINNDVISNKDSQPHEKKKTNDRSDYKKWEFIKVTRKKKCTYTHSPQKVRGHKRKKTTKMFGYPLMESHRGGQFVFK